MRLRLLPAFAVLAIVPIGALAMAFAADVDPALASVAIDDAYTVATVAFTVDVYGGTQDSTDDPPVTTGAGDLTADDFVVAVAGGTAPSFTVAPGTDRTTWTLTFADAVDPHATTITLDANDVFVADGTPVDPPASPLHVPLSSADLDGIVSAFTSVQVPLFEALPDVTVPTVGADGTVTMTTVDHGGLPPFLGDYISNESQARPLTDLLDGLSGLDTTTAVTEDDVAAALETLAAVSDVTFADGGVVVTFDDAVTSHTVADLEGAVVVPEIGLAAELTGSGEVSLSGDLTVRRVAGAGATTYEVDAASTFGVGLDTSIDTSLLDVPLGFVAVDLSGVTFDANVDLGFGCAAGATTCAPDALADTDGLAGSIAFALDRATVRDDIADGDNPPVLDAADPLATAAWDLTAWDDAAGAIDVDLLAPTTTIAAGTDVEDFARANFGNLVNGAQWLGDWLTGGVETEAALATPIPVLGDSLAELGQLGPSLTTTMGGVAAHYTPDENPDTADPVAPATVQEAFVALCDLLDIESSETACTDALADHVRVSASGIEVDLAFSPAVAPTPYADQIPTLDLAHGDLADIEVTGQAGDWSATTVTTTYDLTLGLRTDDDTALEASLGLDGDDWDGDGTANDLDEDADGDGYPESYRPAGRGPVSRAGHPARHHPARAAAGQRHHRDATHRGGLRRVGQVGGSVATPTGTSTLTAADVCGALAAVGGIDADTFRSLNGFADAGACAQATDSTTLNYDVEDLSGTSPVRQAHRTYIVPSATDPLVDLAVALDGADVTMSPRLGYLDGTITGTVAGTPTATVGLDTTRTRADGTLDLASIAAITDAGGLADLVSITTGGTVDADLTWTNTALAPLSAGADLDVVTTVATGAVTVDTSALGDALALADVDPAEAVAAVSGLADQVAEIAALDLLDVDLPVVGTSVAAMVGLVDTADTLASDLAAALPPGVEALQAELDALVATAGLPADVTIGVTADAMTIGLDLGREVTAAYPVALDLAELLGVAALPISPADGGASIEAMAAVDFEPTISLALTSGDLKDRISVSGLPSFEVGFAGEVYGGVHLGPLEANLTGTVALEGGTPGTPASVSLAMENGVPTVAWVGNARAQLEVTGPANVGGTASFDVPVRDPVRPSAEHSCAPCTSSRCARRRSPTSTSACWSTASRRRPTWSDRRSRSAAVPPSPCRWSARSWPPSPRPGWSSRTSPP